MSYTHLTKTELIFIENYHAIGMKGRQIAEKLRRRHEAIYRVLRQLNTGKTAIEIYIQYKKNKQKCGRTIKERDHEHPNYAEEFGHLEGDTIIGHQHKSAIITLVERVSKCIITIKPKGRKDQNIE